MFEYVRDADDTAGDMFPALAAGASHPLVAGLLGLGTAGLAGVVVAMAWAVHTRQIRLAELLARRQYLVTGETDAAAPATNGNGSHGAPAQEVKAAAGRGPKSPVIIEGPDTVVAGEQARYRVRPSGDQTVVSWAAGGGAVAQSPTRPIPRTCCWSRTGPATSRSWCGCARA